MATGVYLSYHLEQDGSRAHTVAENIGNQYDTRGVIKPEEWERQHGHTDEEIENWITEQIEGTEVTVVLIGNDTASSELVHLEIKESWEQGNGIVAIYVHNIEDEDGMQAMIDGNPLDLWRTETEDADLFSEVFETYYWWRDDGYEHIGNWIQEASERAPDR